MWSQQEGALWMPKNRAAPAHVGVREFRGHLAEYLRQVRDGARLFITSHDEVLAEVRPPPATERPRREAGAMKGEIWMAPDFDDLPSDILAAMEGEEE
jgi:antitoxin (DNA-binding transcriptional repressor) of toxin-antitoxin stability system